MSPVTEATQLLDDAGAGKPRWWGRLQEWSLEGPLAAVVWLAGLQKALQVRLMPEVYWGLAATVWWIYLADRLIDALRWPHHRAMTHRHLFCLRHCRALAGFFLPGLAVVLVWLALYCIPRALLFQAASIGLFVGCYLVWQWVLARFKKTTGGSPAKEVVGASIFSVGVCAAILPDMGGNVAQEAHTLQALLMTLFAANLLLITVREFECEGRVSRESVLWFGLTMMMGMGLAGWLLIMRDSGGVGGSTRAVAGPAWACLGGLAAHGVLFWQRKRTSALQLRVLADGAVIAPGLVLWLWP